MSIHDRTDRVAGRSAPVLTVPCQTPPIDRTASPSILTGRSGVEADLWGLPVGDWLEAPGKYAWDAAKGWLNS